MTKQNPGLTESLTIWRFRRRYMRELRATDASPMWGALAAEAVAQLSIGGVHQLREMLGAERDALRDLGHDRAADALTAAIRDLDSRIQILDDLLH